MSHSGYKKNAARDLAAAEGISLKRAMGELGISQKTARGKKTCGGCGFGRSGYSEGKCRSCGRDNQRDNREKTAKQRSEAARAAGEADGAHYKPGKATQHAQVNKSQQQQQQQQQQRGVRVQAPSEAQLVPKARPLTMTRTHLA